MQPITEGMSGAQAAATILANDTEAKAAGTAAQGTANTALANAGTADGKAVAAQGTANTALANAGTALTNAAAALAAALTADGKAVAAQATADLAKAITDYIQTVIINFEGTDYDWGVLDANDKMPVHITKEGEFGTYMYPILNDIISSILANKTDNEDFDPVKVFSDYLKTIIFEFAGTGYQWGVTDPNNKMPLSIDDDGNVLIWGQDVLALIGSGFDLEKKYIIPSKNRVFKGNSLTAGSGSTGGQTYPVQLAALEAATDGRTYTNLGVGGDTSKQIAFRTGAISVGLSVSGNLIPASGAVAVVPEDLEILQTTRTATGKLAYIQGTLTRLSDGTYTFTRATAGVAIVTSARVMFNPDGGLLGERDFYTPILWYGRNNYSDTAQVLADIAASVKQIKTVEKRFAVLSVLNGNYSSEYLGGANYTIITNLNRTIQDTYPRNYIDVRGALVRSYDPLIPQDVTDFGRDIPPSSKRSDNIHLNNSGYGIVAAEVKNFLTLNNW